MQTTIELKHQDSIPLCSKRFNLTSIRYRDDLKIPRNIPIIINKVDHKKDLFNIIHNIKNNIHSNQIIILTENKSVERIITHLNTEHIKCIRCISGAPIPHPFTSKKSPSDHLNERIKSFQAYCHTTSSPIYFEDFFRYFPECNQTTINIKSKLSKDIIKHQLVALITLLCHPNTND